MVYIIILLVTIILASVARKNLGLPIMVAIVASAVVSLWSPQLAEAANKLFNNASVEIVQALIEVFAVLGLTSWAVFSSPAGSGSMIKSAIGATFLGLALIYVLRESIALIFQIDGLSAVIDELMVTFRPIVFSVIAGFALFSALANRSGD